jgi:hypothetical protein
MLWSSPLNFARQYPHMDIKIPTRVAGIPAVARVTYASYTRPDPSTWASDWDFYGGWTLDWEVCDRRGRPAPWLARKATEQERRRIEAELIEQLEGETS